jgi:exodeoxyribonuclease-5
MSALTLTADQQNAIDEIMRDIQQPGARVVLCGYAGTGKTVTTAALVTNLQKFGLSVVVATPTHKARSQVEKALIANGADDFKCVTVHRLLGLKQVRNFATGKESFKPDSPGKNLLADGNCDWEDYCEYRMYNPDESWSDYKKSNSVPIDVVIVDETSMLHEELYRHLIAEAEHRPIIFVGDDRQLLPVKEEKACAAFVEAVSIYKLNKVLRHDGAILNLATATRKMPIGRAKFIDADGAGSKVISYRRRDEWMSALLEMMNLEDAFENPDFCRALAFANRDVEELNRRIHERRYGINAPQYIDNMICVTVDAVPNPFGGKPLLNSTTEVYVRKVEFEMFVAPYDDKSTKPWHTWLLQVEAFDSEKIELVRVLDRNENLRWREMQKQFADNAKAQTNDDERKKRWRMFFERKDQIGRLEPASALTIHKSQGSTFQNVFLHWDIDGWGSAPSALQNQLSYVGITRAAESLHVLRDF